MSRMRLPLIPGWNSILVPCISTKEFKKRRKQMEQEQAQEMKQDKDYKVTHEFFIAGVRFHQFSTVIDTIAEGDNLALVPEPSNKFDPNAIKIEYHKVMLGYVPKKFSSEVCAMIEVGDTIECVLTKLNKNAKPWEQCKVEIRKMLDG